MSTLNELLSPIVTAMGYEWVGCEYLSQHPAVLRVYIDKSNGVTLNDCAEVSRQLSAVLDVEDKIAGRYQLEVSSPGLERPLFTIAHYQQFISKPVSIQLREPMEGRRNFKGIILAVNDDHITLQLMPEEKEILISFSKIVKGHLVFVE